MAFTAGVAADTMPALNTGADMVKTGAVLIILGALLGGCATGAELAAYDDAKCKSYGAQPGSPPYVQCRAQLDAARTTARATIAASP